MEKAILIIEDDFSISEMVMNHLTKEGFVMDCAFDGEEGINKFFNNSFDLVLLDLMLPKLDGIEVLRILRDKSSVPILIMSAKDSDVDKAVGLSLGGDDYIAKPFSLIEITARVKAAIRRATQYSNSDIKEDIKILKVHELTIDLNNFAVIKNGCDLQLTSKEFDILKLFVSNPKRVFTKEQLYSSIWKDDYYGDENVINVHMRRLREKIEDNPSEPKYIKTLWGIGYRFGDFK
jgi:DNA-binding response OmpR family regulator